jgi:hypothetical protein
VDLLTFIFLFHGIVLVFFGRGLQAYSCQAYVRLRVKGVNDILTSMASFEGTYSICPYERH